MESDLPGYLGTIDVYLFDQLQRGRIPAPTRLLDAGCGNGRNLPFFLRRGDPVFGVDRDPVAVEKARGVAARWAPARPPASFQVAEIESLPFESGSFGLVISNAVLHFAPDEGAWRRQVDEMWRVLAPGGFLFARLGSRVGIEGDVTRTTQGRYLLPDGKTEWLLVDVAFLQGVTNELGGELLDPIKTVNVQGRRCMTTWVVSKS